MTQQMIQIQCPNCGKEYKHYSNLYGKVCVECDTVIPPSIVPEFVRLAKERREEQQRVLKEWFRNKVLYGRSIAGQGSPQEQKDDGKQ